ncbi:hypothetical protein J437_LFUL014966 [Ladona fulva]|uniref:Uncharacterized protein n=1 Tax=Ladona fulva TaxID=123851 RepID=A0A8K0KS13_LADFU|nr:hypothetical protein J437_LFUL014966 [Ladona fulva]
MEEMIAKFGHVMAEHELRIQQNPDKMPHYMGEKIKIKLFQQWQEKLWRLLVDAEKLADVDVESEFSPLPTVRQRKKKILLECEKDEKIRSLESLFKINF